MASLKVRLQRRKKGNLSIYLIALFILFMVLSAVMLIYYKNSLMVGVQKIKNGCDFANLSTYKEIDRWKLGSSGEIIFNEADINKVLKTFNEYLALNLNLDSSLNSTTEEELITNISTNKIVVYSVDKQGVITEYSYSVSNPVFLKKVYDKGSKVITPNNKVVAKTSIYTEVNFTINLLFEQKYSNMIPTYTDILK